MASPGDWFPRLTQILAERPDGVSEKLAPQDDMHGSGGREHYWTVGLEALRAIKLALLVAGKQDVSEILDFPCGHGRVLRLLVRAFPEARITASDIDPSAVQFCQEVFGAVPVQSVADPRHIPLKGAFDLIWCGSLLTHLDAPKWPGFLQLFVDHAKPGGVLVFTSHGRRSVEWLRAGKNPYPIPSSGVPELLSGWDRSGFGYTGIPSMPGYGISLSSPAWVCRQLEAFPSLRLLQYAETAWDAHQDIVACVKL